MALSRARTRFNVKGGGILKIREISPSASDTFLDLGYLGGTDFSDDQNQVQFIDEAGNLIDVLTGQIAAGLKSSLMQSSIDEINLIKNASGKYYDIYYKAVLANGNSQELSAGCCKIKPGPVLSFKGNEQRTLAIEIYFLTPEGDFTRTPTDYNITAPATYVLIENAVAKGLPTDTAANLATAVL